MRKYIDLDGSGEITEFAFVNEGGKTELVKLHPDCDTYLDIEDNGSNITYHLYIEDVPKMIKVLELAYEKWGRDEKL